REAEGEDDDRREAPRPEVAPRRYGQDEEDPDADQEGAYGQAEPRPALVREPPEPSRECDHDHAARKTEERGLEGREADELQVELHEDELRVQRSVNEERLQVRDRKVP